MTKLSEQIVELRNQGKSYREIQLELNCSKSTIAYHLGDGQKQKVIDRTVRIRTRDSKQMDDYKESVGCKDCKEKYPHYMLEFDHLPEFEKIDGPKQLWRKYGKERALAELAKCEVVCANCHCIRTHVRNQYSRKD